MGILTVGAVVSAKELVPTKDWQSVGNQTLPAGLEIRIDLTTGQKWARLVPTDQNVHDHGHEEHPHRCGPSCHERLKNRRQGLRGTVFQTNANASEQIGHYFERDTSRQRPNKEYSAFKTTAPAIPIMLVILGLILRIRSRKKLKR